MANITKKKTTTNANQFQFWNTSTDQNDTPGAIAAGDVFRIEQSLSRPGKTAEITVASASTLSIRINSYYTIYPQRQNNEFNFANFSVNIAQGVEVHDTTQTPIPLIAGQVIDLSNLGPIRNIEIVAMTGSFTLLVT